MRFEFQNGLEVLSRFILERTKPKQMGSTVMTGPLLAGLTQSFLDALNAGAVPTICTSWQVALYGMINQGFIAQAWHIGSLLMRMLFYFMFFLAFYICLFI